MPTPENSDKKAAVVITIIILVIVIAIAFVLFAKPRGKQPSAELPLDNTARDQPAAQGQSEQVLPGKYSPYSEDEFITEATTYKRRVLFFHASWCPQCRSIEKGITEGTVPAGMALYKIDYDNASTLRQKYGVTLQTTIVEVASDGSIKKKFVAYDEPTFSAVLRQLGE
jgi:thiol-disulfide isomerase/thioredoxin